MYIDYYFTLPSLMHISEKLIRKLPEHVREIARNIDTADYTELHALIEALEQKETDITDGIKRLESEILKLHITDTK